MPTPFSTGASRSAQRGFSLLEVLISAVILGMTIAGVTSLIGTGRGLDSSSRLRSQALVLAANTLERTGHHYLAYPVPPSVTVSFPVLTTESGATCTATKTDSVYAPSTENWVDASGGSPIPVPYQKIVINLTWNCGGLADTVTLSKRIADVKLVL